LEAENTGDSLSKLKDIAN